MIAYPPTIDADNTTTQIEYVIVHDMFTSSSRLRIAYYFPDSNLSNINHAVFSTGIHLENSNESNNSTWEESVVDNFDLFSKVIFKKSYKLKTRIKTVTKYNPNIVLE